MRANTNFTDYKEQLDVVVLRQQHTINMDPYYSKDKDTNDLSRCVN